MDDGRVINAKSAGNGESSLLVERAERSDLRSATDAVVKSASSAVPFPIYTFDELLALGPREIMRRDEPAVIQMSAPLNNGVPLGRVRELLGESTAALFCRPKDLDSTERSKVTKITLNEYFCEDKFNAPGSSHGFRVVENMCNRPDDVTSLLGSDFRELFSYQNWLNSANIWLSYLGPPGRPHFDEFENFNLQILGRKLFICLEPKAGALYPRSVCKGFGHHSSIPDLLNINFDRFPRAEAVFSRRREILLEAGQMIYLPTGWWHQVLSLDPLNANFNFWLKSAKILKHPYVLVDAVYKSAFRKLAGLYNYEPEPVKKR